MSQERFDANCHYKFHELNETSKCHKLSEPSQYQWPTLHMRDTHELNAPVQMTQTRSQTQSKNSIELTQRTLSSWVSLLLNTSSEFQWASLHRRVMAHWVRDWNGALSSWLEWCFEIVIGMVHCVGNGALSRSLQSWSASSRNQCAIANSTNLTSHPKNQRVIYTSLTQRVIKIHELNESSTNQRVIFTPQTQWVYQFHELNQSKYQRVIYTPPTQRDIYESIQVRILKIVRDSFASRRSWPMSCPQCVPH